MADEKRKEQDEVGEPEEVSAEAAAPEEAEPAASEAAPEEPAAEAESEPAAESEAASEEPTAEAEPATASEASPEEPAAEAEPAAASEAASEEPAVETEPAAASEAASEEPTEAEPAAASEAASEELVAEGEPAAASEAASEELVAEGEPAAASEAASEEPTAEAAPAAASEAASSQPEAAAEAEGDEDEEAPTPRVKPEIPGADLEVDIVREGEDALGRGEYGEYAEGEEEPTGEATEGDDEELPQPIAATAIDLAAGARYRATGKRKTAVARVILKPGNGAYAINGRTLEQHFLRHTLQRQIRQALETVGLEEKMDVVAKMHGGGVSAQADALRHGISRALVEADPNLRSELKRRGFLTRDARVKERKKAGLKKARKRPQFSKR